MNLNYAIQNAGKVAWNGAANAAIDTRRHTDVSFSFDVTADIDEDTLFTIEQAPASASDPCAPGTFVPIPEVLTCVADWGTVPDTKTTIVIPAGAKAGQSCAVAPPCKPGPFVRLVAGTGDKANVTAVAILHGPMGP